MEGTTTQVRWIDVEDRLPRPGLRVLVIAWSPTGMPHLSVATWVSDWGTGPDKRDYPLQSGSWFDVCPETFSGISHWALLPDDLPDGPDWVCRRKRPASAAISRKQ